MAGGRSGRVQRPPDEAGPAALAAAVILASNPHNSPPRHSRVSPSCIDLLADEGRTIGAISSLRREMHLGQGPPMVFPHGIGGGASA